jgi:23S rRNA (uracil1939-C5)-methyltransferase
MLENIKIEKLVYGGQGLGTLASGKRAFVWNALPGETVAAKIIRKKSGFVDAIAEEIIEGSKDRIEALEPYAYLSTSPWQVLEYSAEAHAKQAILEELFHGEKLEVSWQPFCQLEQRYGYRNKMEYNFWWVNETESVSLALHRRGSHMKLPLEGSVLASDAINSAGAKLIEFINSHNIQSRQLKSVILRSQTDGVNAVVLYVVDKDVANLVWTELSVDSFTMYYSNPKSPASVATELLLHTGKNYLNDKILDRKFRYSPEGFFQINIPIYNEVLREIAKWIPKNAKLVDMYAGVGSIGMSMPYSNLTSIEIDESSSSQAHINAESYEDIEVVLSESEKALEHITAESVIILDPPRAGLHKKVIEKLLDEKPLKVIYLSCNPATQARDIAMLSVSYKMSYARGYNFFPATPHIESLVVLDLTV